MDLPGDVFGAISAPARRDMIAMLHASELPVMSLAESFDMSLSAVSQHLAILRSAGLVSVRKEGKQRLYRANPEPLQVVAEWVERYGAFWPAKLSALGDYLEETTTENS